MGKGDSVAACRGNGVAVTLEESALGFCAVGHRPRVGSLRSYLISGKVLRKIKIVIKETLSLHFFLTLWSELVKSGTESKTDTWVFLSLKKLICPRDC